VIVKVTEPWADAPLRAFIEESRVQLALLLHPSGQVIGQSGFAKAMDVMSACALAAAIHASAGELGRQLEGKPFGALHYAGAQRQLFLAPADTPAGTLLLLTVFDETASLGLVQLYFKEFRARLAAAAPSAADTSPVLNEQFERELNRNLATLFGRA
jgi:predicted regulator of Ras-like GTPase activity (Roadblock/LC7/MglB family)